MEGFVHGQGVPSRQRDVFSKNYQLGERYSSGLDEPMVSVKNYSVIERVARAVAIQDFVQVCEGEPCQEDPLARVRGNLGEVFDVTGAVEDAGVPHLLIRMRDLAAERAGRDVKGEVYLAVDLDGVLRQRGYVLWRMDGERRQSPKGLPLRELVPTEPIGVAGPLFTFETEETFLSGGKRYLSYDLIYRGLRRGPRGSTYGLLYREYSRDSTELPVFEQLLQFPVGNSSIDILGLRLTVHAVDADSITFTVVEDSIAALAE